MIERSLPGDTPKADITTLSTYMETSEQKERARKLSKSAEVIQTGDKIILPAGVPIEAVDARIHAIMKAEDEPLVKLEHFSCHPNDGLVAFSRVIKEAFGMVGAQSIQTFFGPRPPVMERIPIGYGVTEECFADGEIIVPGLPDVKFRINRDFAEMRFSIAAFGKKKHQRGIGHIFDAVTAYLKTNSIYKGKAVDTNYTFMDVSKPSFDKLIFNDDVKASIEANCFAPIRHRERLQQLGIPFKRGVLLYGVYGTGKTETAHALAAESSANEVTFLYLLPEHFDKLPEVMRIARHYAPSIIFSEDIDAVAGSERDSTMNRLLNEIDGITAKQGHDVMVVCTTNHVERLEPALLRPGRLDAVIEIGLPDSQSARKLITLYGRGMLAKDFDYNKAGVACAGMVPAFIGEAVKRAAMYGIAASEGGPVVIRAEDVALAATGMKEQLRLASPREDAPTNAEVLAKTLRSVITDGSDLKTLVRESALESVHKYLDGEVLGEKALENARKESNGVTAH